MKVAKSVTALVAAAALVVGLVYAAVPASAAPLGSYQVKDPHRDVSFGTAGARTAYRGIDIYWVRYHKSGARLKITMQVRNLSRAVLSHQVAGEYVVFLRTGDGRRFSVGRGGAGGPAALARRHAGMYHKKPCAKSSWVADKAADQLRYSLPISCLGDVPSHLKAQGSNAVRRPGSTEEYPMAWDFTRWGKAISLS